MKSKDYISYKNQAIKLDPKTLKNLKEPEVLLKVLDYVAVEQPFSFKKEKSLIQFLIDVHYDNKELHEKKFFSILLLHAIKLNHFDVVQNLLNKNSSNDIMNKFIRGNEIWTSYNSHVDWERKRLSYTPLVMAASVRNAKMFKFILDKSDFTSQVKMQQFPLEQITEDLIASITHDTFEKNEILMNFTQAIFYNCPEKMDKFIQYYDVYKNYDLTEMIKSVSVENKKLDMNKVKNFSNEFVSYFEKIQLEKILQEEKSQKKRMKI
jgi:hypothetical protein